MQEKGQSPLTNWPLGFLRVFLTNKPFYSFVMDTQKRLNLLNQAQDKDWTIKFSDGDKYALDNLDIHKEIPDAHGEIDVDFKDCLECSNAERNALKARPNRIPNIWYNSNTPVGKTYSTDEIETIFDNATNDFVLESNDT